MPMIILIELISVSVFYFLFFFDFTNVIAFEYVRLLFILNNGLMILS